MMKKVVFVLCLLVVFTGLAYAQECEVLRAGSTHGWLPVAYLVEETGETPGIAHDLLRYIGEQLNIPVEIDAKVPWKRMLAYLESGKLDLCAAIYWTEERDKIYKYTVPFYTNEARVFVKKGNEFEFDSFDDLIGLRGGIPSGGSFGNEFDTFAKENNLKLEGVKTKEQRVTKLLAGRNDYFLQDYLDGMLYLKQEGLQDQVVALPHPVATTEVYFAFSRQSPCVELVPQVNEIIEKAKEDGTIQTIVDKYIK